jgi:hypothetical protein
MAAQTRRQESEVWRNAVLPELEKLVGHGDRRPCQGFIGVYIKGCGEFEYRSQTWEIIGAGQVALYNSGPIWSITDTWIWMQPVGSVRKIDLLKNVHRSGDKNPVGGKKEPEIIAAACLKLDVENLTHKIKTGWRPSEFHVKQ